MWVPPEFPKPILVRTCINGLPCMLRSRYRQVSFGLQRRLLKPGLIALAYIAFSFTWVTSSTIVLKALLPEGSDAYDEAEQVKGYAFVLVTGGLLYFALRRLVRQAKADYRESQRLAQFAELSPHAVVEIGPDGHVIYANTAARAAATSSDVPIEQFVPTLSGQTEGARLAAGQPVGPLFHTVATREWRWSFFPVTSPNGAYGYGYDRTEEQRLELQVQHAARMESVGRLAAGVTHDMNNILTAIGGHNSLLELSVAADSPAHEEIDGIRQQIKRASELARSLLVVSRRPDAAITPEPFDLVPQFQEMTLTVRHLLPSRITPTFESAPSPLFVCVDKRELERALLNLAANAADAINGPGQVTVRLLPDGQYVILEVADTGHGIEPDVLPRIFDPFFTTKAEGHGTGLGLASVHAFVTRSNGQINVESTPGAGSTFRIRLPLATAASGEQAVG